MTTEMNRRPGDPGLRVLGLTTVGAFAMAALVTLAAWIVGGDGAVGGAAAGSFSLAVVMSFGTFVVHSVAAAMPSLSLLIALMTYALQIVMIGAFFLVLKRSDALGTTVDGTWLVVGVVVGSLTWSAGQIWLSARARIPMYDLPAPGVSQTQEPGV